MKFKFTTALVLLFTCLLCSAQNYKKALDIYQSNPTEAMKLLAKDLNAGTKKEKAKAANMMGYIETTRSNHQAAIAYFFQAADINAQLRDDALLSDNYNRIGTEYYHLRDYSNAKKYYLMALKLSNNDDEYLQHNLGTVYQRFNQFDSAIYYLIPAREIAIRKGNTNTLYEILCDIGHAYFYSDNYTEAIEWYQELYEFANRYENAKYMEFASINIGNTYHDAGQYELAIDYIERALPLQQENEALAAYLNLAECYKETNQVDLAIASFHDAISSYKDDSQTLDYLSAYKQIIEMYVAKGTIDSVSSYSIQLAELVTGITKENSEMKAEANLLAMQHQEKKQLLEQEIKERDRKLLFWGGLSLLLILLVGIMAYYKVPQMIVYKYNLLKKQNDELKKTVAQYRELR